MVVAEYFCHAAASTDELKSSTGVFSHSQRVTYLLRFYLCPSSFHSVTAQ